MGILNISLCYNCWKKLFSTYLTLNVHALEPEFF